MFEKFIPSELEMVIYKKVHNRYMLDLKREIEEAVYKKKHNKSMQKLKKEIEVVSTFFWSQYFINYNDFDMALYYDHADFWDVVDNHYRSDIINNLVNH